MEILFVTTELAPFVKVGGLADVSAALPKTLRTLGCSVTILLPRFPGLEAGGLLMARRLTPVAVTLGDVTYEATVFDGRLASQVDLIVVDVAGMYDRPGVYGDAGEAYPDNAIRFAVFARVAAEIARQRALSGRPFSALHCHDWATALLPNYLNQLKKETPELSATHSVLTLHTVSDQGAFAGTSLSTLGLDGASHAREGVDANGAVNFLKVGILAADVVTTVSDTYAREIQEPAHDAGLSGVFSKRTTAIVGITNGIDTSVWNPASDSAIASRYDAEDISSKSRCRGALQRDFGFPIDPSVPILASVGRLVPQKGVDWLLEALPKILRATDAYVIVAGQGDASVAAKIEALALKSHGRVAFVPDVSDLAVHRIIAGSDIALMPSRFEPCGLMQMYAQRYGTLPVARATGGLVDTIVDCDAKLETGTGFLFEDETADALFGAVERAIASRVLPSWPALIRRVMKLDRGWERPARRYESIYRSLAREVP